MSSLHVYSGKGSIREKRGKSIKTKQKHVKEEEGKKKKAHKSPRCMKARRSLSSFSLLFGCVFTCRLLQGKMFFSFSNDPEYDYECSGGAVRGKERNDEM